MTNSAYWIDILKGIILSALSTLTLEHSRLLACQAGTIQNAAIEVYVSVVAYIPAD